MYESYKRAFVDKLREAAKTAFGSLHQEVERRSDEAKSHIEVIATAAKERRTETPTSQASGTTSAQGPEAETVPVPELLTPETQACPQPEPTAEATKEAPDKAKESLKGEIKSRISARLRGESAVPV